MAVSRLHTLGAIVVSGSSGFNLDGVESRQTDPGREGVLLAAGGQAYPSYVATMMNRSTIGATVNDIATLLGGVSTIAGLQFPQSTSITTVDAFYTKLQEGGTRASGSVNMRVRASEGMIVINSISVSQDAHATADITIYCTYDGSNAPFLYSTTTALPHVPSVDELFTLGPVSINGSAFAHVTGFTIDFQPQVVVQASDGDAYATYVALAEVRPKITIQTTDVEALSTFGIQGTAQGGTASTLYLRKMSKGGVRVADGTSEHIKFTVNTSQGQIYTTSFGGSNNAAAAGAVVIEPITGGSAILTVSAASAIT